MVRVPTYASYMNLMNQTLSTKANLDLYSFQATTGLKSPNYSGYGISAFSIVNMEASQKVVSNFMENNKILDTDLKAMNTAMESVDKAVKDLKSMLTSFSGMDLDKLTPDYTGGELTFTSNDDVYEGKTITINGTQYTFADNGTGNNIDLSGLTPGSDTYAEDVMAALQAKVGADNPDISFEGNKATFPLYTINGSSSVLNSEGVETGEAHTMTTEQYETMKSLQSTAFAAMRTLVDALNTQTSGKYLFGGGNAANAPIDFPFSSLDEFQAYYDGINIKYPSNSSANLSNRTVTAKETGALTITGTGGNTGEITAANTGGFLKDALTANASTTGDLTFDTDKNTIKATEYGAFNTLKPGDTLVLGNTTGNDGAYIIKSVSEDGKTITLEESTPVKADETVADGGGVKFSTSYPVGSVINMDGFGNNIAPQVQVTGISDDGTTLYVTGDPSRLPAGGVTVAASSEWSMSSVSYYQGGNLTSETRVSTDQSIVNDVTGNDPAFEKLFRALGAIAQGNMVDTRNPADDFEGTIDSGNPVEQIELAMQQLLDAIDNNGCPSTGNNGDLAAVGAKINANIVVLNSVTTNLTQVSNDLTTSVDSLKNVDQTEATVKALMALNNLNASYSVLQNVMSTSLLNYLK